MIDAASFGEFLAFIAGAGLLGAIFNQAIEAVRNRNARKDKASYLALRLASTLEEFVLDALEVRSSTRQILEDHNDSGQLRPPKLPPFPDDPDGWRSLNKNFAARAINFRLGIAERYREVAFHAQYDGFPFAAQAYGEEAILLGLDAWILAQEIRESYDLPRYGRVHQNDVGSRIGLILENDANGIKAMRRT